MPIPPRPKRTALPQTPPPETHPPGEADDYTVPRTLWQYCKGCGKRQAIGCGYVAVSMILQVKLQILIDIGWQIAPKILCPDCRQTKTTRTVPLNFKPNT